MTIEPLLKYISNYIDLTTEDIAFLESKIIIRSYLKGQYVLQHGDICRYQCFVLSGCTKTFYVDREGQEHILMFSIEDWWTSDIGSYITQTPADFNIQCLENSKLAMFSYDVMEDLFSEIPKFERFFRQIIEKGFAASQKRIVRNFSLSAKKQYLYFREQYPLIEQRIPQYMIASYLGITKEFLSKIKSQLTLEP